MASDPAGPEGRWWLDRSSRPHRSPTRTRRKLERKVLGLRHNKKLDHAHIAGRLEMPPSTVHAVLVCTPGFRELSIRQPRRKGTRDTAGANDAVQPVVVATVALFGKSTSP